jgi:ABC-type nitrate/sulfonate/bicarbonate transport system permease component
VAGAVKDTISIPLGRRLARPAKGALGLLLFFGAWQASVPLIGLEPYYYPAPSDVWTAFLDLVRKGILPVYAFDSLERYLAGVAIGVVAGVTLGVAIGLSGFAARLFSPFVNFMFAIVEVAWIPIFVIWWGYGYKTILIALTYVVFFPVLYNTLIGVRTVPQRLIDAVRALGGGRRQVLYMVVLPAALPGIITGLRVGAGFAFRGLIFAEIVAAKSGLGYLIFEGAQTQQTARTIVGMISVGLIWLAIDRFYLRPFESATIERWGLIVDAEQRT